MNVKNLNLSVEELKILAENGQRDFIYGVGYYYENGIRTSVDLAQAAVWYEKAAKKGQAEAAMHLALIWNRRPKTEMSTPSLIWDGAMRKVLAQNRIFPRHLTGTKKQQAREISELCAVWEATISPDNLFHTTRPKLSSYLKKLQMPISLLPSTTSLYSTVTEKEWKKMRKSQISGG